MLFDVGDMVELSTHRGATPSKKLDYNRLGPFTVTKVFQVSLLDRYVELVPG